MTTRRIATAVVAGALVLGGCGPSRDELVRSALADATAALTSEPFGFSVSLEASDPAVEGLRQVYGPTGAVVASAVVRGVVDGDHLAISVELVGVSVLEVRTVAPGEVFVRVDLGALSTLAGGTGAAALEAQVTTALRAAVLPESVKAAVLGAVRGEWVAIATGGEGDVAGPSAGTTVASSLALALDALGVGDTFGEIAEGEPAELLAEVFLDGGRVLDAALSVVRGLDPTGAVSGVGDGAGDDSTSATPADVDDRIVGSLVLTDGRIRRLTLPLSGVLGDAADAEALSMLTLSDALVVAFLAPSEVVPVERPRVVAVLTLAEVQQAMAALDAAGTG